MGCGNKCCDFFAIGLLFGIALVLQGAGFVSPRWATFTITGTNNKNTSLVCNMGLLVSDCDKNANEPNNAVLGLQATAFAFILLINIACVIYTQCCDDGDDLPYWLGCIISLYPMAGLLILIGCIISATAFSTSQFGWGFYCSIAAGCFIIVETLCACCVLCAMKEEDSPQPAAKTSNNDLSIAVPQYSRNDNYVVEEDDSDDDSDEGNNDQVIAVTQSSRDLQIDGSGNVQFSAEETVAVATENGFSFVMRRVTRMVHLRSSILMN